MSQDIKRTQVGTLETRDGIRVGLWQTAEFEEGRTIGGSSYRCHTQSRLETESGQPVIVNSPVHASIVTTFGALIDCRLVDDLSGVRLGMPGPIGLEALT